MRHRLYLLPQHRTPAVDIFRDVGWGSTTSYFGLSLGFYPWNAPMAFRCVEV